MAGRLREVVAQFVGFLPFPWVRQLAEAQALAEKPEAPWTDGTFSGVPSTKIPIPANGILWVFGFASTGTGYNLEAEYRAGSNPLEFPVNTDQRDPIPFDGRVFASVRQTAGPGAVSFVVWPRDLGIPGPASGIATVRLQTSPISKVEAQELATEQDFVSVVPSSIAAATAETVEAAGAGNTAVGGAIAYNLSMEGVIATAADVFVYVALKGHTSGRYYATCFAPAAVAGRIPTPFTAEKIDIVARNQDTVPHGFAASAEVAGP